MKTIQNTMRTGESWAAFLAQYRLAGITDTAQGWDVASASGHTYRVRSVTRLDANGSMYFVMACDCPARGRCRHIDGVEQMRIAEAVAEQDYDGMDVLERTG